MISVATAVPISKIFPSTPVASITMFCGAVIPGDVVSITDIV